MNKKLKTKFNKIISLIVVNCFLLSYVWGPAVAAVSTTQSTAQQYKQIFTEFMLPYSYGQITKSHYAGTDRVVINIQDLHCHPKVQKNISNIIDLFDKHYGVKNIYLEGAYGDVDTSWLAKAVKKDIAVAESILESGRLTGAEYYSAITGKTQIIKGLEEKEAYFDNLKRFGTIVANQDKINLILDGINESTEKIKKQYYGKRQYKLEKLSADYQNGKISAEKYYALLNKHIDRLGIDLSKYENTLGYMMLLSMQKELDYQAITKELQKLVLLFRDSFSPAAYKKLAEETDNFSKIDKLYGYIIRMSRQFDLDLTVNFKNLDKYFQYIELSQKINPLELVSEEQELAREINTRFSETKAQREVVFLIYFEKYLKNYLNSKITADDYVYYKENIEKYKELWNKYVDNRVLSLLDEYLVEADRFYEINDDRNTYFTNNIFDAIETSPIEGKKEAKDDTGKIIENMDEVKRVDVIITGGFHTGTVSDILQNHNVSYIVITPNVTDGAKEAEETYYKIAKEQRKISFQALATLPLSLYGQNVRVLVSVQAFGKDISEKIFGENLVREAMAKSPMTQEQTDLLAQEAQKRQVKFAKILDSDDLGSVEEKITDIIKESISEEYKSKVTQALLEKAKPEDVEKALSAGSKELEELIDILSETNPVKRMALSVKSMLPDLKTLFVPSQAQKQTDLIDKDIFVINETTGKFEIFRLSQTGIDQRFTRVYSRISTVQADSLGLKVTYDDDGNITDATAKEGYKLSVLSVDGEPQADEKYNLSFTDAQMQALMQDSGAKGQVDIYLDDDEEVLAKNIGDAIRTNSLMVIHIFREGYNSKSLTLSQLYDRYQRAYSLLQSDKLKSAFPQIEEYEKSMERDTTITSDFFLKELLKNHFAHGNHGFFENPMAVYVETNDEGQISEILTYDAGADADPTWRNTSEYLMNSATIFGDHKAHEYMGRSILRNLTRGNVTLNGITFYKAKSTLRTPQEQTKAHYAYDEYLDSLSRRTKQDDWDDFWGLQAKDTVSRLFNRGYAKYLRQYLKQTGKTVENLTEEETSEIRQKAEKYRFTLPGLAYGALLEIFALWSPDFIDSHDFDPSIRGGMIAVVWTVRALSIGIGLTTAFISVSALPVSTILLAAAVPAIFGTTTISSSFIIHLLWNIGAVLTDNEERMLLKKYGDKIGWMTIKALKSQGVSPEEIDQLKKLIDDNEDGFDVEFFNKTLTRSISSALFNPENFTSKDHKNIYDFINKLEKEEYSEIFAFKARIKDIDKDIERIQQEIIAILEKFNEEIEQLKTLNTAIQENNISLTKEQSKKIVQKDMITFSNWLMEEKIKLEEAKRRDPNDKKLTEINKFIEDIKDEVNAFYEGEDAALKSEFEDCQELLEALKSEKEEYEKKEQDKKEELSKSLGKSTRQIDNEISKIEKRIEIIKSFSKIYARISWKKYKKNNPEMIETIAGEEYVKLSNGHMLSFSQWVHICDGHSILTNGNEGVDRYPDSETALAAAVSLEILTDGKTVKDIIEDPDVKIVSNKEKKIKYIKRNKEDKKVYVYIEDSNGKLITCYVIDSEKYSDNIVGNILETIHARGLSDKDKRKFSEYLQNNDIKIFVKRDESNIIRGNSAVEYEEEDYIEDIVTGFDFNESKFVFEHEYVVLREYEKRKNYQKREVEQTSPTAYPLQTSSTVEKLEKIGKFFKKENFRYTALGVAIGVIIETFDFWRSDFIEQHNFDPSITSGMRAVVWKLRAISIGGGILTAVAVAIIMSNPVSLLAVFPAVILTEWISHFIYNKVQISQESYEKLLTISNEEKTDVSVPFTKDEIRLIEDTLLQYADDNKNKEDDITVDGIIAFVDILKKISMSDLFVDYESMSVAAQINVVRKIRQAFFDGQKGIFNKNWNPPQQQDKESFYKAIVKLLTKGEITKEEHDTILNVAFAGEEDKRFDSPTTYGALYIGRIYGKMMFDKYKAETDKEISADGTRVKIDSTHFITLESFIHDFEGHGYGLNKPRDQHQQFLFDGEESFDFVIKESDFSKIEKILKEPSYIKVLKEKSKAGNHEMINYIKEIDGEIFCCTVEDTGRVKTFYKISKTKWNGNKKLKGLEKEHTEVKTVKQELKESRYTVKYTTEETGKERDIEIKLDIKPIEIGNFKYRIQKNSLQISINDKKNKDSWITIAQYENDEWITVKTDDIRVKLGDGISFDILLSDILKINVNTTNKNNQTETAISFLGINLLQEIKDSEIIDLLGKMKEIDIDGKKYYYTETTLEYTLYSYDKKTKKLDVIEVYESNKKEVAYTIVKQMNASTGKDKNNIKKGYRVELFGLVFEYDGTKFNEIKPAATMSWLSKVLDFFGVTDFDKRQRIVNIIENPIIVLGIYVPFIQNWFFRQHKEQDGEDIRRGLEKILKTALYEASGFTPGYGIAGLAAMLTNRDFRQALNAAHYEYNRRAVETSSVRAGSEDGDLLLVARSAQELGINLTSPIDFIFFQKMKYMYDGSKRTFFSLKERITDQSVFAGLSKIKLLGNADFFDEKLELLEKLIEDKEIFASEKEFNLALEMMLFRLFNDEKITDSDAKFNMHNFTLLQKTKFFEVRRLTEKLDLYRPFSEGRESLMADFFYCDYKIPEKAIDKIDELIEGLNNSDMRSLALENNAFAIQIFLNPAFQKLTENIDIEKDSDMSEFMNYKTVSQYKIAIILARMLYLAKGDAVLNLSQEEFDKIIEIAFKYYSQISQEADNSVALDGETYVSALHNIEFSSDSLNEVLKELGIYDKLSESENLKHIQIEDDITERVFSEVLGVQLPGAKDWLDSIANFPETQKKTGAKRGYFMFNGHGMFRGDSEKDGLYYDVNQYISIKELVDALLQAKENGANLEDITLELSSCFSWYVANDIYKRLELAGIKEFPQIITAAGFETPSAVTYGKSYNLADSLLNYLTDGNIKDGLTFADIHRAVPKGSNHTVFVSNNKIQEIKENFEKELSKTVPESRIYDDDLRVYASENQRVATLQTSSTVEKLEKIGKFFKKENFRYTALGVAIGAILETFSLWSPSFIKQHESPTAAMIATVWVIRALSIGIGVAVALSPLSALIIIPAAILTEWISHIAYNMVQISKDNKDRLLQMIKNQDPSLSYYNRNAYTVDYRWNILYAMKRYLRDYLPAKGINIDLNNISERDFKAVCFENLSENDRELLLMFAENDLLKKFCELFEETDYLSEYIEKTIASNPQIAESPVAIFNLVNNAFNIYSEYKLVYYELEEDRTIENKIKDFLATNTTLIFEPEEMFDPLFFGEYIDDEKSLFEMNDLYIKLKKLEAEKDVNPIYTRQTLKMLLKYGENSKVFESNVFKRADSSEKLEYLTGLNVDSENAMYELLELSNKIDSRIYPLLASSVDETEEVYNILVSKPEILSDSIKFLEMIYFFAEKKGKTVNGLFNATNFINLVNESGLEIVESLFRIKYPGMTEEIRSKILDKLTAYKSIDDRILGLDKKIKVQNKVAFMFLNSLTAENMRILLSIVTDKNPDKINNLFGGLTARSFKRMATDNKCAALRLFFDNGFNRFLDAKERENEAFGFLSDDIARYHTAIAISRMAEEKGVSLEKAAERYFKFVLESQDKKLIDDNTVILALCHNENEGRRFNSTVFEALLDKTIEPRYRFSQINGRTNVKEDFLKSLGELNEEDKNYYILFRGHGFDDGLSVTTSISISPQELAQSLWQAYKNGINLQNVTLDLSCCYSYYFARHLYDALKEMAQEQGVNITYPNIITAAGLETEYAYTLDMSNEGKISTGNMHDALRRSESSRTQGELSLFDLIAMEHIVTSSNITMFSDTGDTESSVTLSEDIDADLVYVDLTPPEMQYSQRIVKTLPGNVFELSIFKELADKYSDNKILAALDKTAPVWEEFVFRTIPSIITLINPFVGIPMFVAMQSLFIFAHSAIRWLVNKDLRDVSFRDFAKEDFSKLAPKTLRLALPYLIAIPLAAVSPVSVFIASVSSILMHTINNFNAQSARQEEVEKSDIVSEPMPVLTAQETPETISQETVEISQETVETEDQESFADLEDVSIMDIVMVAAKKSATPSTTIGEISIRIVNDESAIPQGAEIGGLSSNLIVVENEADARELRSQGFKAVTAKVVYERGGSRIGTTVNGKTVRAKWNEDKTEILLCLKEIDAEVTEIELLKLLLDALQEGSKNDVLQDVNQLIITNENTIDATLNAIRTAHTDSVMMPSKEAKFDLTSTKTGNFTSICRENAKAIGSKIFIVSAEQIARNEKEISSLRQDGFKFVASFNSSNAADNILFDGAKIDASDIKNIARAKQFLRSVKALALNKDAGLFLSVRFSDDIYGEFANENINIFNEYGIIPIISADSKYLNTSVLGKAEVENITEKNIDNVLNNELAVSIVVDDAKVLSDKKDEIKQAKTKAQKYAKGYNASLSSKFNYTTHNINALFEFLTVDFNDVDTDLEALIESASIDDMGLSAETVAYIKYLKDGKKYEEILGFIRGVAMNSVRKITIDTLSEMKISVDEEKFKNDGNGTYQKAMLTLILQLMMEGEDASTLIKDGYVYSDTMTVSEYLNSISEKLNGKIEEIIKDNEYKITRVRNVSEAIADFKDFNMLMQDRFREVGVMKDLRVSANAVRSILGAA